MILVAVAALTLKMTEPFHFKGLAEAFTAKVEARYWNFEKHQYTAYVSDTGEIAAQPAFAWDMAVQMSSLAAACKIDPKRYQPLFDQASQSIETYGSVYQGVFGYGVLPGGGPPDRYYDDDEWIALAQLDAFDALHDKRYLEDAKKTFQFVMSGESSDLGGGLFWREQEKKSKNTCSNAPAIAVAARIYLATKEKRYLEIATHLHDWVERLKDTDDLMFDNIDLAGKIEKTKWTYNTALMIRSNVLLYQATKRAKYLSEAVAMGSSAANHWVDPQTGAIRDEASFAHHLSEAFLALAPIDKTKDWVGLALTATNVAYEFRNREGLLGSRWDRYELKDHHMILLYQASMARALWMAAKVEP
jgi:predicted alpha-1,6-mannanase (GH76 family)